MMLGFISGGREDAGVLGKGGRLRVSLSGKRGDVRGSPQEGGNDARILSGKADDTGVPFRKWERLWNHSRGMTPGRLTRLKFVAPAAD